MYLHRNSCFYHTKYFTDVIILYHIPSPFTFDGQCHSKNWRPSPNSLDLTRLQNLIFEESEERIFSYNLKKNIGSWPTLI
jgi:hypothetical protein